MKKIVIKKKESDNSCDGCIFDGSNNCDIAYKLTGIDCDEDIIFVLEEKKVDPVQEFLAKIKEVFPNAKKVRCIESHLYYIGNDDLGCYNDDLNSLLGIKLPEWPAEATEIEYELIMEE